METTDKSFNLRWNNHLENLRSLFICLFNEQNFVDVTIACEDGLLKAHQLVLSVCSPFFEMMFRDNPCEHPTVIMRDVTVNEMLKLCQYMYTGSMEVQDNCLSSILNVARELQIKGLSDKMVPNNQPKSIPSLFNHVPVRSENSEQNVEIMANGGSADVVNSYMDYSSDNNSSFDHSSILSPEVVMDENNKQMTKQQQTWQLKYQTDSQAANIEAQTKNIMAGSVGSLGFIECPTCQRPFFNQQNLRRHMQTHSGVKPHQCTYCSLSFGRLSHLQRHHRTHTGERPFTCTECSKSFTRSDKLRDHIMNKHATGILVPKQRGRSKKYDPLSRNGNMTTVSNTQNFNTEQNVPAPVQGLQEPFNLSQ